MQQLTILDVKTILRNFGIVIYTGDPLGDCLLMEDEIKELHEAGLLGDTALFAAALAAVHRRVQELKLQPDKEGG